MSSSSDRTARGSSPAVAVAVVAACVAAALGPVLVGGHSFYHLDTYFEHVPFWHFAAQTVANGDWPWWTPNIRAGYPLHANGEASLLYPLALPFGLALPAHRAVDWFVALHLVLLGAFTWRYLRELAVPPLVAVWAGAAFALSGRMIASAIWPNAVAASCYLPLALLGIERCRRDQLRGALLLAAAVALGLLAGRPQRFVPVLLFAGAYALVIGSSEWRARGREAGIAVLLGCAAGAALGAVIAAPQVLPTLALVADSPWREGVSASVFASNGLGERPLHTVLLPAGARFWPEGKLYPGLLVYAGFALGAWLCLRPLAERRDPRALFFLAATAFCFWLALGGPLAHALCQAVPVLRSLRSPVRFLYPGSFALAMLAALALRDASRRWRIPSRVALAAVAVGLAELVVVTWRTAPVGPSAIYDVRPAVLDRHPTGDLDAAGFPYRFYASGEWVAPQVVAQLDAAALVERFAALPPTRDLAMRFGAYAADGYGEPKLAWKARSYRRIARSEMDQLGVQWLFTDHKLRTSHFELEEPFGASFVYRNPTPLPRALCPAALLSAADADAALDRAAAAGFDASRSAVVERSVETEGGTARGGPCVVERSSSSPTRVALRVRAPSPTWLVLFDTWAPGWEARVNGSTVPVDRANGMFRLIEIPAGDMQVVFQYSPPGLRPGAALAVCGVAAWLALWWRSRRTPAGLSSAPASHRTGVQRERGAP